MNLEKKFGFKSSFYFMAGGISGFDNFYNIKDQLVKKLINNMEEQGFEVGYHGSYDTYNNLELMKNEINKLAEVIKYNKFGCRQHYLRFKTPETWRLQEQLGLMYDTTLSFADKEGFRCGTCFPFKPFDLLEDRVINIWEIPLIVMEGSLIEKKYSSYTPKKGFDRTLSLIETVKKYNGVFTFLWHNSSLDIYDTKWDGWIEVYEDVMKRFGEENCWGTTGRDLINYLENEMNY